MSIDRHPERSCTRFCLSRVFRGRATQSKDLSWISPLATRQIRRVFSVPAPCFSRETLLTLGVVRRGGGHIRRYLRADKLVEDPGKRTFGHSDRQGGKHQS